MIRFEDWIDRWRKTWPCTQHGTTFYSRRMLRLFDAMLQPFHISDMGILFVLGQGLIQHPQIG